MNSGCQTERWRTTKWISESQTRVTGWRNLNDSWRCHMILRMVLSGEQSLSPKSQRRLRVIRTKLPTQWVHRWPGGHSPGRHLSASESTSLSSSGRMSSESSPTIRETESSSWLSFVGFLSSNGWWCGTSWHPHHLIHGLQPRGWSATQTLTVKRKPPSLHLKSTEIWQLVIQTNIVQ